MHRLEQLTNKKGNVQPCHCDKLRDTINLIVELTIRNKFSNNNCGKRSSIYKSVIVFSFDYTRFIHYINNIFLLSKKTKEISKVDWYYVLKILLEDIEENYQCIE